MTSDALPSIQPITYEELAQCRAKMIRGPGESAVPPGVGLWVISSHLIDDIAKLSIDSQGDWARIPWRKGEALRLFGAPVLQVKTPARIVSFGLWCAFCGAWLRPDDDCLCQKCGEAAVI